VLTVTEAETVFDLIGNDKMEVDHSTKKISIGKNVTIAQFLELLEFMGEEYSVKFFDANQKEITDFKTTFEFVKSVAFYSDEGVIQLYSYTVSLSENADEDESAPKTGNRSMIQFAGLVVLADCALLSVLIIKKG